MGAADLQTLRIWLDLPLLASKLLPASRPPADNVEQWCKDQLARDITDFEKALAKRKKLLMIQFAHRLNGATHMPRVRRHLRGGQPGRCSWSPLSLSFAMLVFVAMAHQDFGRVMITRTRILMTMTMLLAGCAAGPAINVKHRIPHGGTLGVVMFQDCSIANQADCDGSGAKAGTIFVRVLGERPGLHAVALTRPVAAAAPLDDAAAIAYAKAKGYRYVVNGEVRDYRGSGTLALHAPRAAVSVRVLNTANGQAWAIYSYQEQSSTRLTGPDALLEDMAKQVAAAIILEKKGERPGNFLLYKQKSSGE